MRSELGFSDSGVAIARIRVPDLLEALLSGGLTD